MGNEDGSKTAYEHVKQGYNFDIYTALQLTTFKPTYTVLNGQTLLVTPSLKITAAKILQNAKLTSFT